MGGPGLLPCVLAILMAAVMDTVCGAASLLGRLRRRAERIRPAWRKGV